MANRIFYNPEGYVEVIIDGDQTFMSFENLKGDAMDILEQLQKEGKPRRGILDISKQGSYTADTNRAAMDILESLNYERLAIFGGGKFLTDIAKAIILAMGKTDNTKIFSDREAAVAWVMKDDDKD